jgi:hypothetical protein
LAGLDLAEGWVLGGLLAQPALYEKVREDISLSLFILLRPLAEVLVEYLENHGDLAACNLAEIASTLGDGELVRQAIQLERKASEWLDPNLSPSHVKMLAQSRGDRGLTIELVLHDSLKQLKDARGGEDPGVTADLGTDDANDTQPLTPEQQQLKELMGLVEKKARQGPDRSNVGLGR